MQEPPEPTATTPERAGEPHRSHFGLWFRPLFLVFVVYPLSIGPAKKIAVSHPDLGAFYNAIYTPFVMLCKTSDPSKHALLWYIEDVWKIELATYR